MGEDGGKRIEAGIANESRERQTGIGDEEEGEEGEEAEKEDEVKIERGDKQGEGR